MGRRFTRKNRKRPPRRRGSRSCSDRPVCQHRQLSAHPTLRSPARSDERSWKFGRLSGFFADNTVADPERAARSRIQPDSFGILSSSLTRIQRSFPQVDRTCGSGVVSGWLGILGQNSDFLARIPLSAQNTHSSCSCAVTQRGILTSSIARTQRSIPRVNPTFDSGVARDLLGIWDQKS